VFSDKPGVNNLYFHEISLHDKTPFYQKPYNIPIMYKRQVENEMQKMLDWGIIVETPSSYVSPMCVIARKDKPIRLCLDLRKLNKQIFQEHEIPLDIEEILQQFHGIEFFTSIDLCKAYWQLPIKQSDCKYVGFSLHVR
jgi:hypothetical protein